MPDPPATEKVPFIKDAFLEVVPSRTPRIETSREVFKQETVIKQTSYKTADRSIKHGVSNWWDHLNILHLFRGIIPIFGWIWKYKLKTDLPMDIIAGLTVAVMHIPHGIAYGMLAGVTPSNGLYTSIFPGLIYMILGTSRHISIGTFAIVSIMTYKVVQTHAHEVGEVGFEPLEVVTATTLMTGVVHLAMSVLRLGTLASLLSDPLVSGFTTGAAYHVITAQLKDATGLSLKRHKGAFKIIKTLSDIASNAKDIHVPSIIVGAIVAVFMLFMNEIVKPRVSKKTRFPIPSELFVLIVGTLVAKYMKFDEEYGIHLLGEIPLGLPAPIFPKTELLGLVAVDAIAIAIVSYSIVMSMGLTFAKKHQYEIRPNQELFALGTANCVSSCFSCLPLACSLSRSLIQEATGGQSQIASFISALIILVTVIWVGPFFRTLPRCVLAMVIIIALKPMLMQAKHLKKFSQQGKLEFFTWVLTFLTVVLIDIDYGLLVGVICSLLGLYLKGMKQYFSLLGKCPGADDVYVDLKHHSMAIEVPQTKIFRYSGALNFATRRSFRKVLCGAIEVNYQKLRRASQRLPTTDKSELITFKCLILDFSFLSHIDISGCTILTEIKNEMGVLGVRVFLANPADCVYNTLMHSISLGEGPFEIFPTIHDAVIYANACRTA